MTFFPDERAAELRDLFFESAAEILQAMNEAGLALEEVIMPLRRDFTVLIATNNLEQAARLSDTTCYLANGEVVETGETPLVFSRPSDRRTEDFLAGRPPGQA